MTTIIGIAGSLRKGSFNASLLRAAARSNDALNDPLRKLPAIPMIVVMVGHRGILMDFGNLDGGRP